MNEKETKEAFATLRRNAAAIEGLKALRERLEERPFFYLQRMSQKDHDAGTSSLMLYDVEGDRMIEAYDYTNVKAADLEGPYRALIDFGTFWKHGTEADQPASADSVLGQMDRLHLSNIERQRVANFFEVLNGTWLSLPEEEAAQRVADIVGGIPHDVPAFTAQEEKRQQALDQAAREFTELGREVGVKTFRLPEEDGAGSSSAPRHKVKSGPA